MTTLQDDVLAVLVVCGIAAGLAILGGILELHRWLTTPPCYCDGPWAHLDPGQRPYPGLARKHRSGDRGCWWPRP